ncbi:MAG: hypothetical protein K2W95_32750 [Candidatus Obscuribacterales bacterium]|nr:hypothetical protein [Candidatus Obscuribacterales bacterium]
MKIENFVRLSNAGNVKATFDVICEGGITIRHFVLVQQRFQRPWMAVPQSEYYKDGRLQYRPLVQLPKEVAARLKESALKLLAERQAVTVEEQRAKDQGWLDELIGPDAAAWVEQVAPRAFPIVPNRYVEDEDNNSCDIQ